MLRSDDQFDFSTEIFLAAKIFGYFMVIAGLFFTYVFIFNPSLTFPGIQIETVSERFGLYSTGARVIGSVVGILIALFFNNAALLAIMLATRVIIELGDVIVGLTINNGQPDSNTFTLLILAVVEIFFITKLIKSMKKAV